MKYYLFFEDYDGNLHQIGYVDGTGMEEQDVIDGLWKQINAWLSEHRPERKVFYYNIFNTNGFTVVDFGSHTEFFKILPTVNFR